jgi:hypothetical protein
MSKYKPNSENIPLRQINTSMPALIVVYDLLNADNVVLEKRIDFANYEDRKWMGRITFWALTNHHSIETIAIVDAEAETMENK